MSRIRIETPPSFSFSTMIAIRITDLNYGGHVGNDTVLSLVHEGRMQFLKSLGYDEMNLEGVSLIMSDAGIEFKSEMFYGQEIRIEIAAANITRVGFDLYYKLSAGETICAVAKTGMICFDYQKRKVVSVPVLAAKKLAPDL